MDDILAKKNRHLFLEEKDNQNNSFIGNINDVANRKEELDTVANSIENVDAVGSNIDKVTTVADNISDINDAVDNIATVKTFNDNVNNGTIQQLLEAFTEDLNEGGNQWVVRLTELGESIVASSSAFNYSTVVTVSENIDANGTLNFPAYMKYKVGTHMLLVSWNGTVCYAGDQYEEVGAYGEWSKAIVLKQPAMAGDKIQLRVVAMVDSEAITNALADLAIDTPLIAELVSEIPEIKDSIAEVEQAPIDGLFWVKGYGDTGDRGSDISERVVRVGTEGVERSLTERFGDIINVKDFGAKGDGITDDTNAIQTAIDNAPLRAVVYFPDGSYKVSTISISEGQAVILYHPTLVSETTALVIDSMTAGSAILNAHITAENVGLWVKCGKQLYVSNLRIDITHEQDSTSVVRNDNVYGLRVGGVVDHYAGNENVFENLNIYASNLCKGVGLWVQGYDNIVNNVTVKGFKYGYDLGAGGGGGGFFNNLRAWIPAPTSETSDIVDFFTGSTCVTLDSDVVINCLFSGNYHYVFAYTGEYKFQRQINGLAIVGDSEHWISNLPIYISYVKDNIFDPLSIEISNLNIQAPGISVYYSNFSAKYIPGFYTKNTQRPYYGPKYQDSLTASIGSGEQAELVGVLEDRETICSYLLFGRYTNNGSNFVRIGTESNTKDGVERKATYVAMSDSVFYITGSIWPESPDTYTLGNAYRTFSNIYSVTGPWASSDARMKDNVTVPSDALMRAWSKVNFKVFQYKDSIAEKGEEKARLHIGVIAQEVQAAFAEEGLDAFRYGLIGYDSWEAQEATYNEWDEEVPAQLDENGRQISAPSVIHHKDVVMPAIEAGDKYSIRYEEALALECAYQRWLGEQRDAKIEALMQRISALENNH